MDNDSSGAGQEVAQPPLYYSVAALFSMPFLDDDLESLFWHNPNFGYQAPGTVPDNKNWLIHTDREHFPWRGAVLALHVARLTSLLFGGITVVASWGLGREAFGTQHGALLTAALVAFQPQFVFMSSVVSNDSAAAALSTLALWLTVRTFRRGLTYQRALIIGAVVGLSTLTKTSTLLLIPLIGAALLWTVLQERCIWSQGIARLSLYINTVFLVGSWWYLRNYTLYGDLLGISSHINTPWRHPEPVSLVELLPEFPLLVRSFWGAYGWGHIFWPDVIYVILTLMSFLLTLRALRTTLRPARTSKNTRLALILAASWFGLIFGALLRWMQLVGAPHGRLLFPALSAWALVVAAGARKTRGVWIGRGFLLILVILTTLAPGTRLWTTFAPPRLLSADKVWNDVAPVNFTYGDRVRLLGVDTEPAHPSPGDTLTVTACWEALQPMTKDYLIYVQLLGKGNRRVGERHTYPGLGKYPTSLWNVDRVFCDQYRLSIASWTPTPEQYDLLIGLYHQNPNASLPVENADQTRISPPSVGKISIVPRKPIDVQPSYPVHYELGDNIQLIGYDKSSQIQSNQPFTITLYWKAKAPIATDYKVFVHVLNTTDEVITQHDGRPRSGYYPTSAWYAGDVVPDKHTLAMPNLNADQGLRVGVGMYNSASLERLPVTDATGHRLADDIIPLFVVGSE